MRSTYAPALALLATVILNSPALSQEPERRPDAIRSAIRDRIDTNGDGQISAEERDAARAAYRARGGQEGLPERTRPSSAKRPDRSQGGQDLRSALRDRIDTNGDGQISAKERDAARAAFQARGGFKGLPDKAKKAIAERLDRNKDGKVDERERAAGREALRKHLQSRGGGSEQARRPSQERGQRPEGASGSRGQQGPDEGILRRFDSNGDGKIDSREADVARNQIRHVVEVLRKAGARPERQSRSQGGSQAPSQSRAFGGDRSRRPAGAPGAPADKKRDCDRCQKGKPTQGARPDRSQPTDAARSRRHAPQRERGVPSRGPEPRRRG